MKCKDALKMMGPWLDKELSQEKKITLEQHIAQCSCCTAEAQKLQDLLSIFDRFYSHSPPQGLQNRTLSMYDQALRSLKAESQ